MKSKKYFSRVLSAMIAIMMSVSFAACGSDDNDEPAGGTGDDNSIKSLIIGKWQLTDYPYDYSVIYEFKSNGRYTCVETSKGETVSWSGKYVISGTKVTMYFSAYDDNDYEYFIITDITKNQMKILFSGDEPETYTKI